MSNAADFYLEQLKPLVGGTIVGLTRTGEGAAPFEDEYFGLVVKTANGKKKTLVFLSDDEGNGPGSFEILDE